MIVAKSPQLTDGYGCRFSDLHPSNRHAGECAVACALWRNAADDAAAKLIREGRYVIAKVGGMVSCVLMPDLSPEPDAGFATGLRRLRSVIG